MQPDNRKWMRWLLPVLIVLVLVVSTVLLLQDGGKHSDAPHGQPGVIRPPNQTHSVPAQTTPSRTEPTEETIPTETTEPKETIPEETEPWEEDPIWEDDPFWEEEPEEPLLPQEPEPVDTEDLLCRKYARFSGQYVEDGRDELVENVAAILVTNKSDQFLDLATLTYDIDGEIAEFIVTGLPAGRSAWVMEATGMVIPNDAVFTFVKTVTSFRGDVTADPEEISMYADANMLTAVNNTDRTLEDVFVYYKTLHTDGSFFGGITYRVEFGTLEPGASAQALAGHFNSDNTEIVRVGWADQ